MQRTHFLAASAATLSTLAAGPVRAAGADVSVAYAGSLVTLMEKSVGPAFAATGHAYRGQGKGSTALANLIRGGLLAPDVFISADTESMERLRGPANNDSATWYATFATTRMQIAYSTTSKAAADFAAAARGTLPWYQLLRRPGIKVARTDPAQDPKGYRVLLVLALAERYYRQPGLATAVTGGPAAADQIIPEEDALARLQTGEIDAIWVYSTESAVRNLPVIELDPHVNLGDPTFAPGYADASVAVAGKTISGSPIAYALTVPVHAPNPAGGEAFVTFLLSAQGRALMERAGLTLPPPSVHGARGAVPVAIRDVLGVTA